MLAEAHYVAVKEREIVQRAELFEKASADQAAFFSGNIKPLPDSVSPSGESFEHPQFSAARRRFEVK